MPANPLSARALDGRVAIVTGGAGGLGAAQARALHDAGASVLVADIRREAGEAVAEALGTGASFINLDVSDRGGWQTAVDHAERAFGPVDILVNNAGWYSPQTLLETTEGSFDGHFSVNTKGVFLGMQAVAPGMRSLGRGAIVNIASTAALRGAPGQFAYNASKWAVRGMTRCAVHELSAHGIRINTLIPGPIETPMLQLAGEELRQKLFSSIPLGHFGVPVDVAGLVCFLVSDAAAFINGAEIVVDGGQNA